MQQNRGTRLPKKLRLYMYLWLEKTQMTTLNKYDRVCRTVSKPLDARYRVMKKLSVLLCIFLLSACAPSEVPSNTLVERNGIKYEGISQMPFTGVSTEYYENGQLKEKRTYKDGAQNGLGASYYENGRLEKKWNWKDGKLHGLWEGYYENGELRDKTIWKDGKQHGPSEWYRQNGQLRDKKIWKDGKEHGPSENYHENGQLNLKNTYKDGELNGLQRAYHTDGQEKDWSPYCYQNDKEADMSKCK